MGFFEKSPSLSKNCCADFLGNIWGKFGYILFLHLVTLSHTYFVRVANLRRLSSFSLSFAFDAKIVLKRGVSNFLNDAVVVVAAVVVTFNSEAFLNGSKAIDQIASVLIDRGSF